MSDVEAKTLYPLVIAQLAAVEPGSDIWLGASAGTGKTQVLTARVIRLLLMPGVRPENLLCITFTKAGAAEMADRINRRLASWVQMKDEALASDLRAIGADFGPEARIKARQLFASVLDAPGGGLQIMTIHSFCQSLLGSFPEEAGLVPGFQPIEGREQQLLLREILSETILKAEQRGDERLIAQLQAMSIAMGEAGAISFLHKCAAVPDAMAQIPEGQGALIWARRLANVSFSGSIEQYFDETLSDAAIDRPAIVAIADMNREWGSARGRERADKIDAWLALDSIERGRQLEMLHSCWWSRSKGEPMVASKGFTPPGDTYAPIALELALWTRDIFEELVRADYADRLAGALSVGKAFAQEYAQAKHARGCVDFDDLIRHSVALLSTSGMAQWVRYKLDRRIDHVLVDESQDTNRAQWDIIEALTDDFFSREPEPDALPRTIFSVGDFKQAIYGFQGTSPQHYEEAGQRFAQKLQIAERQLQQLELSQSFRSTPPVLRFVNEVIAEVGEASFGISRPIEPHRSELPDVGLIELLAPVAHSVAEDEGNDADDEENWITSEKRLLAKRLADHVVALIEEAPWLATQGRRLRPGDIMFLLRSRGELASLLVAQLHERNIPVAGVDRLRLLQPLVVQDLLAAIRFALQPEDHLSLACLLVSPLIGWSQDDLLRYGYRGERKIGLWQHLREQPEIADDLAPLHEILAMVDFTTPYQFLERILSGPSAGRRKFSARLGRESLVPMEEMLNAAIEFQAQDAGGLQRFLNWFDSGDIEIKREGESGANEVRVMTVHGAKGLQAPVVIMADITADPTQKPDRSAEIMLDEGQRTPLLPIRKAEQSSQLAAIVDMQAERDAQEHLRLLYVAMTRAEERLIMTGSLGIRRKGAAPEQSWYHPLQRAMAALGTEWEEDGRWGRVMRYRGTIGASAMPGDEEQKISPQAAAPSVPSWLFVDAPDEQRPPRPLAPSRIDDDDYGDAPASPALRAAAERGKLIHALFERIEDEASLGAAEQWLALQLHNSEIDGSALMRQVRAVVANPEWSDFFGPDARSEVPLAAVVGETVISGRIDRMVIEPGHVRILDFKTGRGVPVDTASIPVPHLRQMAHYVAALEAIFPNTQIEAALLFTHESRLFALSDALLAPFKPPR